MLRWTVAMTVVGLSTAAAALARTGSFAWALVGLFAAGVVANSIASARAGQKGRRR